MRNPEPRGRRKPAGSGRAVDSSTAGDPQRAARAGPAVPELRIAGSAAFFALVLGAPMVAFAALAVGPGGALGAAIAVALVVGMFGMSAGLVVLAARFGPGALMGAVLGGFVARLGLYGVLIVVLTPVEAIHGPSLAVCAALLLCATLGYEALTVSRHPEFFELDKVPAADDRERTKA